MISGGIKVDYFAQIRLILKTTFGDDPKTYTLLSVVLVRLY